MTTGGRARTPAEAGPAAPRPTGVPARLCCALGALAAAAALLAGVHVHVAGRLPGDLPFYAAYAMSFKVNGNVLQTAAFRAPGVLPIYGSSELDRRVPNRADAFFACRPSGFAVFPIGRGGATDFPIAQKLAAVGGAARGKKVVIFLSPSWFLVPSVGDDAVATNLGLSQLSAVIFGGQLSPTLEADLARRLQDFPAALEGRLLLAAAVRCLAAPGRWSRLRFAVLSPLGRAQSALFGRFDEGVILWESIFPQRRFTRQEPAEPPPPTIDGRIAWSRLLSPTGEDPPAFATPPRDPGFAPERSVSREFSDLALLLRVLAERRMEALFISQPLDYADPRLADIAPQTQRFFHEHLRALLGAADCRWRDFSERENDPSFFSDTVHPSARAWLYYDREIDRFYSGARDE